MLFRFSVFLDDYENVQAVLLAKKDTGDPKGYEFLPLMFL